MRHKCRKLLLYDLDDLVLVSRTNSVEHGDLVDEFFQLRSVHQINLLSRQCSAASRIQAQTTR